ncbi:MAG: hypothetical protein ACE5JG_08940, partial [Planctomycetota bacterium]
MRTQKCHRCGALLDVSHLEKGAKFSCSSCGSVLAVGRNVAAKRSLADAGPAFKPRSTAPPKVESTRSRRAAVGRRGAPAPRARPAQAGRPLSALVGGVVVVGVVLAVALSGGGGGAAPTAGGPGSGAARAPTAEEWWTREMRNPDMSEKKLDRATIERLVAEGDRHGFDRDPSFGWAEKKRELYRRLVKIAPEHAEANRSVGKKSLREFPDFDRVWKSLSEMAWLPNEYYAVLDQLEDRGFDGTGDVWLEPAEYERYARVLHDFIEWRRRVAEDPTELEIAKAIQSTRAHPILGNYGAVALKVHPFVVFFGSRELKPTDDSPEERERVEAKRKEMLARAERRRPLYDGYLKVFEERYRKPLDLPPFKPTDILFQWTFEDREGFNRYNREAEGHEPGGGVLAYFSPQNHWVFSPEREAGEIGGISNENAVAHETTHQIHWHFSKDPQRKMLSFFDQAPAV